MGDEGRGLGWRRGGWQCLVQPSQATRGNHSNCGVHTYIYYVCLGGGEHAHVYYVHAPICNIHV